MKKVLVIGGSGFLGSHVADILTHEEFSVTVFDNKVSKYLQANQKMIIGSITDRKQIRKAIKEVDIVYHFAAIADIKEARDNPEQTVEFNVMGTIFILEACKEFNIERFIYSSSIYVYTEHGSFYRSSKQSCELFMKTIMKSLDYRLLF